MDVKNILINEKKPNFMQVSLKKLHTSKARIKSINKSE